MASYVKTIGEFKTHLENTVIEMTDAFADGKNMDVEVKIEVNGKLIYLSLHADLYENLTQLLNEEEEGF